MTASTKTGIAWEKYIPSQGGVAGRRARDTPAVRRGRTQGRNASLILPEDMRRADKVDVFLSGDRFIGFHMHPGGKFKVISKNGAKASRSLKINIPKHLAHRIPYGTTNVTLGRDGDKLVLDLDQLPRPATE